MLEPTLAGQMLEKFTSDHSRIARYAAIAERCPLPAFIIAEDGTTILYLNPAYKQLTGRALDELNLSDWVELVIYPDDREKVRHAWRTFLATRVLQPHWHRYQNLDGQVFDAMTLVDRIEDGYVGFIVPQCGKIDCPVRHLNSNVWQLWQQTKHALGEI